MSWAMFPLLVITQFFMADNFRVKKKIYNTVMILAMVTLAPQSFTLLTYISPRHWLFGWIRFRNFFKISQSFEHLIGVRGHVESRHGGHPAKLKRMPKRNNLNKVVKVTGDQHRGGGFN